eukprot:m.142319 g.142319  ORF g.142319 m.142319 type:complete len:264 (+) comp16708_c0_seq12:173-964(+)
MSAEVAVRQAIERFVLLAKGTHGAACRAVIDQALQAPDTFVFGELIDAPTVVEVCRNDQQAGLLLQLFAHGTLSDYKAHQASLPALTPVLLKKLRLLSLVTLANQSKRVTYQDLLRELDLTSVRELEDLIIDGIYMGLLGGKLDQKNQCLEVDFATGRDLKAGQLQEMTNTITTWALNCHQLLGGMQEKMNSANAAKASNRSREEAANQMVEEIKKTLSSLPGGLTSHLSQEPFDDGNRIRSKRPMRSRDQARDLGYQLGRAT